MMDIIPFRNPAQLPREYGAYIPQQGRTPEEAARLFRERYPWYEHGGYWHEPTRTLWIPADWRRKEAA